MIKLVWKVDWPMRWGYEGVDFEPGGIDHAAASGSFVVASDIARKVLGVEPPLFQGYGWLSIAGLGDMHSSTGNNITPATVMKVYEPDMIRWLFAKYEPKAGFSFNFDDTIIRHYSEFDKGLEAYKNGEADEYNEWVYDLAMLDGNKTRSKVPFGVLSSVATIVDFNPVAVKEILAKVGVEFSDNDKVRLERVKNWITVHQPGKLYKLLKAKNQEFYDTISDEEKVAVKKLYEYVTTSEVIGEKDVQQYLYSLINDVNLTKKENMQRQQRFFKVFYNLLFGTDMGPRLYLFLAAIDKKEYAELLNF
jgi:lysyl-tRNA synthetase class 1